MVRQNLAEITGSPNFLSLAFLEKVLAVWYWFLISLSLSLLAAFIFLRYAAPEYLVTATLIIRDDAQGAGLGDHELLTDLGLPTNPTSVDNEIEILKSRRLMAQVVENLGLNIQYYATGRVKTTEIYEKSPFILRLITHQNFTMASHYKLTILGKNQYRLANNKFDIAGRFGDTIVLPEGRAILRRTRYQNAADDVYTIAISGKEETIRRFQKIFSVAAANKLANTVKLSITDILPSKGEALIEQIIDNYLKFSIKEKNSIADSTLQFIDKNLDLVSKELSHVEKSIESFRKENQLINSDENGRLLLQSLNQYVKEKEDQTIRLKVALAFEGYLDENPDQIVPSSFFREEEGLMEAAHLYNEVQLARSKTLSSVSRSHPIIRSRDEELHALRLILFEAIKVVKQDLELSISSIEHYQSTLKKRLSQIPGRERVSSHFARQQQTKQDLYIFLLKKRIETSISRSSTSANARVIDSPKADVYPVQPKKQLIFLIAGCIGTVIPLIILHLRDIFNNKVRDKSDVLKIVDIPITAEIGQLAGRTLQTFEFDPHSLLSEQFRTLRTNIQFLNTTKTCQTILLTSSMGGEGKSFIAVNLAHSFALAAKNVILIELDLRKPNIAQNLHLGQCGFSDFLLSNQGIDHFIQTAKISSPFDVITAGTLPPNPVELLTSPRLAEAVSTLRQKYDYILFDSPPLGLVTDARILGLHADLSLYVIRQSVTYHHQLSEIKKLGQEQTLPNMHLIINGVTIRSGYQYDYGYKKQSTNPLKKRYQFFK